MTRPPITPDPPDPAGHETPLEELSRLLRDERRRWRARFIGVALIVLIGAGFLVRTSQVATEAKHAAVKAQEAVDLIVAQRTEARVTACKKDLRFATAHNAKVVSDAARDIQFIDLLATGGGTHKPDPKFTPILDAQKASYIADRDANLVPVPDCSPAGIAATYPAVPKSKK